VAASSSRIFRRVGNPDRVTDSLKGLQPALVACSFARAFQLYDEREEAGQWRIP
jgi:hypothetical protein